MRLAIYAVVKDKDTGRVRCVIYDSETAEAEVADWRARGWTVEVIET